MIFHFCLLGIVLYCWDSMNSIGSIICLKIGIIPTFFILIYLKLIIFIQNVIIGNEDEIRSYRFNIRGKLFQVSPCFSEHGEDLSEMLKPFARRKNIRITY